MKKFATIVLVAAVLWVGNLVGFGPEGIAAEDGNTIPCEFGGVRMGAFMSDLEGMTHSRSVHVADEVNGDYDVRYYTRTSAPREMAGVALRRVEYGFCEDYVCVIRVEAQGREAYDALVGEYARLYGTEDRSVYLYESFWDRYCDEESADGKVSRRWILCEHETDNCAMFSISYQSEGGKVLMLLGDQYAEP